MRHYHLFSLALVLCACIALAGCSKTAKVRTYPMGEKVYIGKIVYTVFETQFLTQLGEGLTAKVPQNRYFLVRLSVANSSGADVPVPNMTIEDDTGNSYSELTNGDGVPQWIGFLRQVKPAQSLQGNIVFDAPPRHYRLRVYDENEEKSALIDIPLTFNAEMPQPAEPGAEKK